MATVMDSGDVTLLLQRWEGGDGTALEQLMPLLYAELRRMAGAFLRGERIGHTLQPTALVHELYLRLAGQRRSHWENRGQFFAVSARLMRRILVDHAREKLAAKRGGAALKLPIEEALDHPAETGEALLAVDQALTRFAELDPERARLVEMRYFAGLSLEEIAAMEGTSLTTVKRHWSVARMWLHRELAG